MSYLLTQMSLYMLATFVLGLVLGWLFWRAGKSSSPHDAAWAVERAALIEERDALRARLGARGTLSADETDLRLGLEDVDVEEDVRPQMPVAATPVSRNPRIAKKPASLTAPRGGAPDDLKVISGVGPAIEKLLHGLGFYHFDQIAAWTPAEEAWVDDNLDGFRGSVSRDNWIEQAKRLSQVEPLAG